MDVSSAHSDLPNQPLNASVPASHALSQDPTEDATQTLLDEIDRLKEQNTALADAIVNSAEIITELEEVKARLADAQSAAEQAHQNSNLMAETIFEGTHDAMMVLDRDYCLVAANQNARRMFELPDEQPSINIREHLSNTYSGRKTPQWFERAIARVDHGARIELFRDLKNTDENASQLPANKQWIELHISRLGCSTGKGEFLVTAHDISRRVEVETQFQHQAFHDNVTQLPNRRYFVQRVENLIGSGEANLEFSICFLDLDHFKTVNDTLGHEAGDELLIQVAQRIKACTRSDCVTARFGGDEFALLIPKVSVETVNLIGQRILAQLQRPFAINGNSVYVGASIGMTRFPDDAMEVHELLQNADVAMYAAKEGGRNQFHRFNKELATRISKRQLLLEDLRESMRNRKVNLEYQPKWCLRTNQFSGCEALLRWKKNGEAIAPQYLVEIAECSGLILPLGYVIFETAINQVAEWHREFDFDGKVAINMSPRQLVDPELVPRLCSIVEKAGLAPSCVELEITETAMIENFKDSFGRLRKLQEKGFSIAIDDFGTGYSSLSYLKSFPISTLKIDRSFVNDLPHDRKAVAVAEAILALGHGLELEIVAEGVETKEQLEFLRESGCDQIQGYLLSRSIAGTDMSNWVDANLNGVDGE